MDSNASITKVVIIFLYAIKKLFFAQKREIKSVDLLEFEQKFEIEMRKFSLSILSILVRSLSESSLPLQREEGKSLGLSGLEVRKITLQTSFGPIKNVSSLYARNIPEGYSHSRHLLGISWSLVHSYSPLLIRKVSTIFACSPSYMIGSQLLSEFGINMSCSTFRRVMNRLGTWCFDREADLSLSASDDLKGKKVVISIDGGRTRIRHNRASSPDTPKEEKDKSYDTSWVEPKVFVVDILDETGRTCRKELPVYGCRFSDDDMYELLTKYLKKLKIDQASEIQIIADGAPWIWNNTSELLKSLNVPQNKITETLDYYHAIEHLNKILEMLPKKYSKSAVNEIKKRFYDYLKQGNVTAIIAELNTIFIHKPLALKTQMNYFIKHEKRMQYADYQRDKLMIGSGIIESAIRRIINLRFKNTSTFWHKQTVQKLYFFRQVFLAQRMDNFIHNLAHSA